MGGHALADVNFDFAAALSLARQFYAMAPTVASYQSDRVRLAGTAQAEWKGRFATVFEGQLRVCGATAAELDAACKAVANLWAEAWAHAAAQQQNIEWSRYCQKLDNQRSGLQKAWDSLFGDPTKYPPAPKAPPVPVAPDFARTIDPYSYSPT